jgi:hypothetical protein
VFGGAATLLLLVNAWYPTNAHSPAQLVDASPLLDVGFEGCGRILIDGGSNTGEAVERFVQGGFYTCAMSAPNRNYVQAWARMSVSERRELMAPLNQPSSFCIRSFEAAPELLQPLQAQATRLTQRGFDVRFIDGQLSNRTAVLSPKTIVRYGNGPTAVSATTMHFGDVHVEGPRSVSERTELGRSYSLRDLVSSALSRNASSVIALKLDIEGAEWWALDELTADPSLLCGVSYIFSEFHGSATAEQRAKLPGYGLPEDMFEILKSRAHAAMERPGCRLKLYWRSFWASCGDQQRFEWRNSKQVV